MPAMGSETREYWGRFSIALHWLTFLMVVGLAIVGLTMGDLSTGRLKLQVFALHKSFGLTVLGITALRILWRLLERRPSLLPGPPWQRAGAVLTHYGLYVLLLLVPFSGWWYNSTAGFPLKWFGLFKLPPLGEFDRALKHQAKETHEFLFWVLAATIAVHAAAALWHHYRVRDRTLSRMLPWMERRDATSQEVP
jgi:cytochrome b561